MIASRPLVLHVLPLDMARGSQKHARALRDALDAKDQDHRVLTLFASEDFGLQPDFMLNTKAGRSRALGFDPTAFVRLFRALRRLEPSLLIAHGSEALKYLVPARPNGIPIVYHRIGLGSGKLDNPIRFFLHRALVRRADVVVALSTESIAELRRIHGLEPVLLIPNARDATVFRPSPDSPLDLRPLVLFLGHLVATKRPELFLNVVSVLRARSLDFDAAMAGDGPFRNQIETEATKVGVQMLGNRQDVPQLLTRAGFLVFTSVPEGEGMPGVLIEAGLCGIPVVSTDVPGAREVIDSGVTGFVVGTDDVEGLVSAAERLISDRVLRTRMGANARIRCVELFDIEGCAAKWSALIANLLSEES